ncbi:trafficking protein particle complex subunit 12-like [Anneissia japonica]|uniref:trafficking protein particle complex subunit 12-like n=1 Tax=Anneissia japonica TaxID=1529436 RepID=UPI0014257CCD|nr:trafficking protein particle complex subunit 12-like [Anneissia japonica]
MESEIRESADLTDELLTLEEADAHGNDDSEDVPLDEPSPEGEVDASPEESDGGHASKQKIAVNIISVDEVTSEDPSTRSLDEVNSPETENIPLSDESPGEEAEPSKPAKPPPIEIKVGTEEGFQSQPVGSPESQMTWMQTMGGAGRMFTGEGDTEGVIPRQPSVSNFFKEDIKSSDTEGKNFFDSFMSYEYSTPPSSLTVESTETPLQSLLPEETGDACNAQDTATYKALFGNNKEEDLAVDKDHSFQIDLSSPEEGSPDPSAITQEVDPIIPEVKELKPEPSSEQQQQNLFQSPQTTQIPFLQKTAGDQDDIFTAALSGGDSDRRHNAWIPTEKTRQVLISRMTSPQGSEFIDKNQLTMPGVSLVSLKDPFLELVVRYMGEVEGTKRCTLALDQVSKDEFGIKQLLDKGCLRAAVDLSAQLLANHGQGIGQVGLPSKQSPQSLQLWLTRIALLMKLREYSIAETESKVFGDFESPDLYFEFYPDIYPGRKGSMVPFSLRVLVTELLQYCGKHQESMDQLYKIKGVCEKILLNLQQDLAEDGSHVQLKDDSRKASIQLWKSRDKRILYSIGNCLLAMKDFNKAASIFESLLDKDEDNDEELLSGIGRIHLQLGDLKSAQRIFQELESRCMKRNKESVKVLMNRALLRLSQHSYPEAYKLFSEVVNKDPTNHIAVNNLSVCQLYMGKLREALASLENLVHRDPEKYLDEGLIFNLCTLYELESSRSMHKKQTLLGLVNRHRGDGFNVACLKMS